MTTPYTAPVRLGVISFAHGHVNAYIDAIAGFDDARVIAGWDADAERGRAQCDKFGLAFEPDLGRLLARADIDAVFVTSPTNMHAGHCVMAARAGKGILLQKPMALSLADCNAIAEAVTQYGVPFSLCYQMRADPVNQQIKALIDTGAVGRVAMLKRRHAIGLLLNKDWTKPGNWHIDPLQNMGMFMDDASHAADFLYWMLGKPVSVMAEIDNIVTDSAPDDNGVALYRFAQGEIGVLINSSTQLAAESTTEIYGDAGVIVHNYGDSPSSALPRPPGAVALKLFRAGASDWEQFGLPADTPHAARIRGLARPLVDYLLGKRGPVATAADGRVCIAMILGAYESARTGQRVKL
jgi:predicted dehydrogenase